MWVDQLAVLRRQIDRPALNDNDRTLLGSIAAALPRPKRSGWIVTPDTLLRWHRRRIARHRTQTTRGPGRPATTPPRSPVHERWFVIGAASVIDTFDEIFRAEGLKTLKTPGRTPVANSYAERWIGSIRRELLDRTIIWNQHQLERLVVDHIDHYNNHRPHRSLNHRPPLATEAPPPPGQRHLQVVNSAQCDGLINEYRNAA